MSEVVRGKKVRLSDLREIGWRLWDPLAIVEMRDRHCDDEYDSYLMAVAGMAQHNGSRNEAIGYLMDIAERHMEVAVDRKAAEQTVDAIWRLTGGPATIIWPPRFAPGTAPIHVVNTLDIGAPPAAVWAKLIRATGWPDHYANASNVRIAGGSDDLFAGAVFRWRTFGVDLVTTVAECVAPSRLAWLARGIGVEAYHAWLIEPTATGCRVITEETQYGALARLGAVVMPNRMHDWHQKWLEGLARGAVAVGMPARAIEPL